MQQKTKHQVSREAGSKNRDKATAAHTASGLSYAALLDELLAIAQLPASKLPAAKPSSTKPSNSKPSPSKLMPEKLAASRRKSGAAQNAGKKATP